MFKFNFKGCSCSPNIITYDDWLFIKNLNNQPLFFARKFDPLFNNDVLNNIDQNMFGLYSTSIFFILFLLSIKYYF